LTSRKLETGDAKEPLSVQWLGASFLDVPVRP
jgi:hypothetical protein